MGVDATIVVRLSGKADAERVRKWAYRMGDAVGADFFWRDRAEGQHNLTVVDPVEQDYLLESIPAGDGDVLRVNTRHRYYGPGYERGDWPRLAGLLGWLNFNLPAAKVYYGGDSGGRLGLADGDFLDEMWAHWAEHGRLPYAYNGPEQERRWNRGVFPAWPTCELCHVKMSQYGFGGSYAAFHCAGCGHDLHTRDNGATWTTKEAE